MTSCECDQLSSGIESQCKINNQEQTTKCRKCDNQSFIILDKVHQECKTCFLESCNKKIRSTIGKSKLIRNNEAVLVAFSGGASSSALLDLIKCSIEYEGRREQKFRPSIIYVDKSIVYEKSKTPIQSEQRLASVQNLLKVTHETHPTWPIYWTTIEMCTKTKPLYMVYNPDTMMEGSLVNDFESITLLYEQLSIRDSTEKQQYVQECTMKLVTHIAQLENFPFVFYGSSSDQLANNLMVDVILGHGAAIHSVVDFCDKRYCIPILRPMKDFSKKEISFYNQARKVSSIVPNELTTGAGNKSSIQALTESFLCGLSVDYPSTYSTLMRIGTKMQND